MQQPETIGRYIIERVLGRGAMGVIYLAHDPQIDRDVAIKLIRADLLGGEDRIDYLARFRREAQAAGRCGHPNIVTIYDFAEHDGNPFLVMEYVDGMSLSQAREAGTVFTPEDAALVMEQVLDALEAAHAMGIVHRDIKPANILLIGGRHVKVTDFGISRINASELTQDGSVVGTPSYMSPEQCRGGKVDARSDLFSTGAVLYELLAGERPFLGRNFAEVMHRVLNEQPPDLRLRLASTSPDLLAVLDRALAKRQQDRFASASEMRDALRAAIIGVDAVADRTIFLPRLVAAAAQTEAASPPHLAATEGSCIGMFDVDTLATLERRLAEYVGPIARYMVQSAIRKSNSVERLCETLAGNIDQVADREAFRQQALRQLKNAPPPPGSAIIVDAELERARLELARYLGPMARVLVKRAASGAASPAELWQRLATHLDHEQDRRAFLKAAPGK